MTRFWVAAVANLFVRGFSVTSDQPVSKKESFLPPDNLEKGVATVDHCLGHILVRCGPQ